MREEILTEKELNDLCRSYQKLLRVQDWQIEVKIVGAHTLGEDVEGDFRASLNTMSAVIRICSPETFQSDPVSPVLNMRRILIHEMIHIVFSTLGPNEKDEVKYSVWESGIDRIATTIYGLTKDSL